VKQQNCAPKRTQLRVSE